MAKDTELNVKPDTFRCPAATYLDHDREQCLLPIHHVPDRHIWPADLAVMLKPGPAPKIPPTQWTVIQGLGTLGFLLAFTAFLIAWFTR